jgi:hypothetical protein
MVCKFPSCIYFWGIATGNVSSPNFLAVFWVYKTLYKLSRPNESSDDMGDEYYARLVVILAFVS